MKYNNKARWRQVFLLLSDIIILCGILASGLFLLDLCGAYAVPKIFLKLLPCLTAIIICNWLSRLYGGSFSYPGAGCPAIEELKRLTLAACGGYAIIGFYFFLSNNDWQYLYIMTPILMVITALSLPIGRWIVRSICFKYHWCETPVLVAGTSETGRLVNQALQVDRFFGFKVVGYLNYDGHPEEGINICGKIASAKAVATRMGVDYLICALPLTEAGQRLNDWLKYFQHILIVPDNQIFPTLWTHPLALSVLGGLEIGNRQRRKLFLISKLISDVSLAFLVILFSCPLWLFLTILVKISSRGPVFYRAKRLGRYGREIEILKFRTMYVDADIQLENLLAEHPELAKEWQNNFKLHRDPRITPIGRFLRRTSLDELPQFWNVLKGEMAIIGPRPIVNKERKYYGANYRVFSRMKPGITGLWQVSGRSDTGYPLRVKLDLYYIKNWSVWMDYFIFLKTIKEVLSCRGAR